MRVVDVSQQLAYQKKKKNLKFQGEVAEMIQYQIIHEPILSWPISPGHGVYCLWMDDLV